MECLVWTPILSRDAYNCCVLLVHVGLRSDQPQQKKMAANHQHGIEKRFIILTITDTIKNTLFATLASVFTETTCPSWFCLCIQKCTKNMLDTFNKSLCLNKICVR